MDGIIGGWTPPPAPAAAGRGKWYQVPRSGDLELVVLSGEPTSYWAHYASGKMRLCGRRECPYCAKGIGAQLRFVFCVVDPRTEELGLVELPESAGLQVRDLAGRNGGLRGMSIGLSRHTESKRSTLEVVYRGNGEWKGWENLPALEVLPALLRRWQKQGEVIPPQLLGAAPVRSHDSTALVERQETEKRWQMPETMRQLLEEE